MARSAPLELLCLIAAGAVSAGVHAAIAPAHLHEWLPLGASFFAVAALLAAIVAALAMRPFEVRLVGALGALLAAVAAAYLATRLTAIPPLDPEREPFDSLGVGTSLIEVLGAAVAIHITRPKRARTRR
jgi:4-amino-4-deoxy-L-arabinose transferase-like glycosyltransferase